MGKVKHVRTTSLFTSVSRAAREVFILLCPLNLLSSNGGKVFRYFTQVIPQYKNTPLLIKVLHSKFFPSKS